MVCSYSILHLIQFSVQLVKGLKSQLWYPSLPQHINATHVLYFVSFPENKEQGKILPEIYRRDEPTVVSSREATIAVPAVGRVMHSFAEQCGHARLDIAVHVSAAALCPRDVATRDAIQAFPPAHGLKGRLTSRALVTPICL